MADRPEDQLPCHVLRLSTLLAMKPLGNFSIILQDDSIVAYL